MKASQSHVFSCKHETHDLLTLVSYNKTTANLLKEELHMRCLWEFVSRFCPKDTSTAVFLAANILCWTSGTLFFGVLFCAVAGQVNITDCIANVMCLSVYSGIIFGLFGGILYLMRHKKE